jgi:hypothetical protein
MKRSCPANEFFYVIEELKAYSTLAKSLFLQKTEAENFFENSKRVF